MRVKLQRRLNSATMCVLCNAILAVINFTVAAIKAARTALHSVRQIGEICWMKSLRCAEYNEDWWRLPTPSRMKRGPTSLKLGQYELGNFVLCRFSRRCVCHRSRISANREF